MRRIIIETVEHSEQRYPTVGDWYLADFGRHLQITVSRLSDPRYEFLVALHELIEQQLCAYAGIGQETVDAYDQAHLDSESPGDEADAPYRSQHEFATAIEMLVAQRLGVDWKAYGDEVNAL